MLYATIRVTGAKIVVINREKIPAGIIGAQVQFEFDELWKRLSKTVVFESEKATKDVILPWDSNTVDIPPEVVAVPCSYLRVGLYGTKDGAAVPTLWTELGRVHVATNPSGDESTGETLPVWAQLADRIDHLSFDNSGVKFEVDHTLKLENGILSVNTTNESEKDNTKPITSAGVYNIVGNIEALLKTI